MSCCCKKVFLYTLIFLPCLTVGAETLTVAVASNFSPAAEEIAAGFTTQTCHELRLSAGSTGKLFAQISNHAPYDIFLAADSERPALLEVSGLGVHGTRVTYAIGGLVMWSADAKFAHADCRQHLEQLGDGHLAIANPDTAPYGMAAREYLIEAGLWEQVKPQLVYGENIAQTLQFVATGNARIGLIARSQSVGSRLPEATCNWPIPSSAHRPLEQQAVLLARAAGNPVAAEFMEYLVGAMAQQIIVRHGYTVPE